MSDSSDTIPNLDSSRRGLRRTNPSFSNSGGIAAGFGAAGGIFALFFFSEVPKVRKDILIKIPLIGDYYIREIPPEDNPF